MKEDSIKLNNKIKKYDDLILKADNEYRRIHGIIKKGKFKGKIKDLFKLSKISFKEFIKNIKTDKNKK